MWLDSSKMRTISQLNRRCIHVTWFNVAKCRSIVEMIEKRRPWLNFVFSELTIGCGRGKWRVLVIKGTDGSGKTETGGWRRLGNRGVKNARKGDWAWLITIILKIRVRVSIVWELWKVRWSWSIERSKTTRRHELARSWIIWGGLEVVWILRLMKHCLIVGWVEDQLKWTRTFQHTIRRLQQTDAWMLLPFEWTL